MNSSIVAVNSFKLRSVTAAGISATAVVFVLALVTSWNDSSRTQRLLQTSEFQRTVHISVQQALRAATTACLSMSDQTAIEMEAVLSSVLKELEQISKASSSTSHRELAKTSRSWVFSLRDLTSVLVRRHSTFLAHRQNQIEGFASCRHDLSRTRAVVEASRGQYRFGNSQVDDGTNDTHAFGLATVELLVVENLLESVANCESREELIQLREKKARPSIQRACEALDRVGGRGDLSIEKAKVLQSTLVGLLGDAQSLPTPAIKTRGHDPFSLRHTVLQSQAELEAARRKLQNAIDNTLELLGSPGALLSTPRESSVRRYGVLIVATALSGSIFVVQSITTGRRIAESQRELLHRSADLECLNEELASEIRLRGEAEKRSRKLIRAVEQSPASVVITDEHGKIEYVNPNFTRLTGYTMEEAVGENPRILNSGNIPKTTMEELWTTILAGHEWRGELQNRKKNGELYWEFASISPIFEAGKITHFVAVKENITERKQAESELSRLNAELVDASRKAGMAEIATGVLHNVGNVLNSVNVSAALILEQLESDREEKLCKAAALIMKQGDNLADFVCNDPQGKHFPNYLVKTSDTLLARKQHLTTEVRGLLKNVEHIKEIIATQQKYANRGAITQDFALSEVMEDALRIADAGLSRAGVCVERVFDTDAVVSGDRHKLIQIIVNLISNAKHALIDSRSSERKLTLRIRWLDDQRVAFVVEDTGIGFSKEVESRLFEHGFTTKKDGHGFGLHSSANAARELGGKLIASSDGIGKGARFTLIFPVETTRTAQASTAGIPSDEIGQPV